MSLKVLVAGNCLHWAAHTYLLYSQRLDLAFCNMKANADSVGSRHTAVVRLN